MQIGLPCNLHFYITMFFCSYQAFTMEMQLPCNFRLSFNLITWWLPCDYCYQLFRHFFPIQSIQYIYLCTGKRVITGYTVSPCYYRVARGQSGFTLYSCLNVREILARIRREIWSISDYNWTQTHSNLHKQTFNHLAKLAKWLRSVVSNYL